MAAETPGLGIVPNLCVGDENREKTDAAKSVGRRVVSFCVCCAESACAPESLCASTSRCKLAIIEHTALATDLVPSVDHDDTHFVFACSRVFAAVTGTLSERGFNG
jgi:hypothetical protein